MKPLYLLIATLTLGLSACRISDPTAPENNNTSQAVETARSSDALHTTMSADGTISLVGKWYRFSNLNGYVEFEIDSQYVKAFSEKMGLNKLEYKIKEDTFKYLTIDFSAKMIPLGDTMVVLEGKENSATLIRFEGFDTIPEDKNSQAYATYEKEFAARAEEIWKKMQPDRQ